MVYMVEVRVTNMDKLTHIKTIAVEAFRASQAIADAIQIGLRLEPGCKCEYVDMYAKADLP